MKTKSILSAVVLAGVALLATGAEAKTEKQKFDNLTDVSAMFFWLVDGSNNAYFSKLDPKKDAKDWNALLTSGGTLAIFEPLAGDPDLIAAEGEFKIEFEWTTQPVQFHWAEVLFDGTTAAITASGLGNFDDKDNNPNNKDWYAQTAFDASFLTTSQVLDVATHFGGAPVPLPDSMVLLFSALGVLGVTRRGSIARTIEPAPAAARPAA